MATKDSAKEEPGKELSIREQYLPAIPEIKVLEDLLSENLAGTTPNFEAIKIPTGGGLAFEIPTEGEPETSKEIVGVILDHYHTRAFWPGDYEGGNKPPQCASMDGVHGTGDPGGVCLKCPNNEFGTGRKQRGKACKEVHRVFILTKGSLFPFMIPLPPSSGAGAKYAGSFPSYMVKLSGVLKKASTVVSKVKLIQDKNQDGISYSKTQFFKVADLDPETQKQIDALIVALKPAMRRKPIEADVEFEDPAPDVKTGAGGLGPKDPWDDGAPHPAETK